MIETDLGSINISRNRLLRLSELHDSNIKGFFYKGGILTAKTLHSLSDSDKAQIIAAIQSLSNAMPDIEREMVDYTSHPFRRKTAAQIENYIENNVTDLASAKAVLKTMARALSYVIHRSNLDA